MIDHGNETKRGMLWLGSATALTRFLDVAASLVVIALLDREQMGTAALVLGAGAVVESVSGLGIGHALIQAKQLKDDETHSLLWTCCAIGVLQALVLIAASPWIADVYVVSSLLPMVATTGLKVFFVSASIVPHQLLSKHLKFREASIVQTLCSLAEGAAKILLASLGFGAWSLVLANVVRGLVLVISALSLAEMRPRMHFAWSEARGYLSFGLRIAGSGVLYQTYRNADYFLIGKMLGVDVLGIYRVAFEVGMQPLEVLLNLINRVSYPIYAKLADDRDALRAALLRSTRSLVLLGAPIVAFLFQSSDHVLALVTAARWAEASPAIQILVWGSLLRGAAHMFPQVYVAAGRPGYATFDSFVSLVLLVAMFWLGLTLRPDLGMLSVCWAWIVAYPALLQMHLTLTRRITPLPTVTYLRALAPGLVGALLMSGTMALVNTLDVARYGHLTALMTLAAIGLGTYAIYLRVALKITLRDLAPSKQAAATLPSPATQIEAG